MTEEITKRLNADEAQAKAAECREMAKHVLKPEHRIMLHHMAETWDRIAVDVSLEREH